MAEENIRIIDAANVCGNCTLLFFTAAFRGLYIAPSAFAKLLHCSCTLQKRGLTARNNLKTQLNMTEVYFSR